MARTVAKPDVGNYNRPGLIKAPAAYSDNGQGGNANANTWTTVRGGNPPLMVHVYNGKFGRGLRRTYQYGQLYPTADHWAEMHYANDTVIDATMILVVDNDTFQILGAIDEERMHTTTVLALVQYQAKGSK